MDPILLIGIIVFAYTAFRWLHELYVLRPRAAARDELDAIRDRFNRFAPTTPTLMDTRQLADRYFELDREDAETRVRAYFGIESLDSPWLLSHLLLANDAFYAFASTATHTWGHEAARRGDRIKEAQNSLRAAARYGASQSTIDHLTQQLRAACGAPTPAFGEEYKHISAAGISNYNSFVVGTPEYKRQATYTRGPLPRPEHQRTISREAEFGQAINNVLNEMES